MNNDKDEVRKLSLIKYLLNDGYQKTKLPQPNKSFSILSFHDALELFLDLLATKTGLDFQKKDRNFIEYIDQIDKKLEKENQPKLAGTRGLVKLNRIRVDFKHYGITSDSEYPEEAFQVTSYFLSENTLRFFGVDWNSISLIDLIVDKDVKQYLKIAYEKFEQNDQNQTVASLALSFAYLLKNYESNKITRYGESPFFFGKDMTFLSSFHMRSDEEFGRKMSEFIDKTKDSIESIREAVKIMSFGIEYRKYARFAMYTPTVQWTMAGTPHLSLWSLSKQKDMRLTKDEFDFAIEFVIESALKIQEFEFSINAI